MRNCPLCGSKPLLLSLTEVVCVNRLCSAEGVVTKKNLWNRRAEVISRDDQILKELELEYALKKHEVQIRSTHPEITW